MKFVLTILACIALYNCHHLASVLGMDNVLSKSADGDIWTFVIDNSRNGAKDLQRIGINISLAIVALVWGWERARAYAVAFAFWFVLQAVQIVTTCNCTVAEHIDWIILAALVIGAHLWGRYTPKEWAGALRIVWNKFKH